MSIVYVFEADNRSVYKCLLYMYLKQTIGQYTRSVQVSIVYVFEADNRSVYKCVVYGFEADNRLYMDLKQTIGQYTSVCCICI